MALADMTFAAFTLFNALQIVSYIPQIVSVAHDRHGATAISYSSWAIWLAGAAATVAYATVNIWDVWLAVVNAVHAICCLVVILLTAFKRYDGRPRRWRLDLSSVHGHVLPDKARWGLGMASGTLASGTAASAISTDIVAKLSDAIENLETIPSDEMLVLLNEALDVIRELIQISDAQNIE